MTNQNVPPNKIAFIIDGEVVDVLHTDDRLAAIFLSDPKVVDVTSIYNSSPNPEINMTGWTYDGVNFNYPAVPVESPDTNNPPIELTPEMDKIFREKLSEEELNNVDINNIPKGLWIDSETNNQ